MKKGVTADSSTLFASRIVISLSNLLFIPLLTKNLSVAEYGVWAQLWEAIPFLSALLLIGFDESMSRFFPSMKRKHYSRDFLSLMVPIIAISTLATLLIYAFSSPISTTLFNDNESVVRYLAVIVFIWTMDYAFYAFIRSLRKIRIYSILIILQNVFEMGLAVTFVMMGRGVTGAIFAILITRVGIMLISFGILMDLITISLPSFENIRKYAVYGIPTLPMAISIWVLSSFDRYMIAIFLSTKEVGYYSPAYTIGQSIPFLLFGVFYFTLTPYLSGLYDKNDITNVKRTLSFMMKMALVINIPYIFGSFAISRPLLEILSTETIAANSYKILPIVSIGVSFLSFKMILSQTWMLEKKTYKVGASYTFAAVLNIVLNYILIPIYGIWGAAIATMIAYGFDLVITLLWSNRELLPSVEMKGIFKITASSAILYTVIYLFHEFTPLLRVPLSISFGLLAYVFLLRALKIFNAFEKEELKEIRFINKILR